MRQDDLRLRLERAILDHPVTAWASSMGILVGLWAILARRRHG